jgi:flagellar P-ring protein precursor FlgI
VTINGTEILRWAASTTRRSFEGEGDSQQSNRLRATSRSRCARRLPNGNLLVRGEKWITINQGKRIRSHPGIIRPVDIAPDNSVPSSRSPTPDLVRRQGRARRCQLAGLAVPILQLKWAALLMTPEHDPETPPTMTASEFIATDPCALRKGRPQGESTVRSFIAAWRAAGGRRLAAARPVHAERVKDIASVAGVRSNQLVGYGLVVGLDGTGDQTSQAPFTCRASRTCWRVRRDDAGQRANPQLKNVAAVTVTPSCRRSSKPGQTIDVTVSRWATREPARRKPADGAAARHRRRGLCDRAGQPGGQWLRRLGQGRLAHRVNVPSGGRVPNGATVEREVPTNFATNPMSLLNLQYAGLHHGDAPRGGHQQVARRGHGRRRRRSVGARRAPADPNQRIAFVSAGGVDVEPGEAPARVIVNSRTGTVVIGSGVRVMPAAVSHGSLSVTITERAGCQPAERTRGGRHRGTWRAPKISVEQPRRACSSFIPASVSMRSCAR